MFDRLLISCPNTNGGLVLLNDNKIHVIDNLTTTGLFIDNQRFVRGFQFDGGVVGILDIKSNLTRWIKCSDIHDVLIHDESLYAVNTETNTILQYDLEGHEMRKWSFSDKKDSWHINCLAVWNDRLIFSAFGEFDSQQGYKGNTNQSGFVQDLLTGERLITGLSQPHSPSAMGDDLLIANSEKFEVLRVSESGAVRQRVQLDGYTRGICITEHAVYVGISQSRNINNSQSDSAAVVSLDPYSLREVGRICLEADEIYTIAQVACEVLLPEVLTQMSIVSNAFLAKELNESKSEALTLQQRLDQIRNSRSYKIARWISFRLPAAD